MEESEETTFADRIKFIRGSLSKVEFARALGIARNTLLQWETNKAFPNFEKLQKIHEKFKVNINWLLSGEAKPYLKRLKYPQNIENRIIKLEARMTAIEKKAKKWEIPFHVRTRRNYCWRPDKIHTRLNSTKRICQYIRCLPEHSLALGKQ